ncbi:MAG: aminotransferase class V-fold PLP-dependent enzyme [bacterium]|nr:aminotransferase class V-fold PLP-dependent enzyme [bacterium]
MSQNAESKINRRNFLKLAGLSAVGGAAAVIAPGSLEAASRPGNFLLDRGHSKRGYWRKVQKSFMLDPQKVYMNIGTTGSMPRVVLQNYNHYNRLVAKEPWDMGEEWGSWPYMQELIDYMAPQYGADADELVLSRNTTDGMCSILGGLQFEAGDEILTTHHEHVGGISPLYLVRDRYGVSVNEIEIPVFPESDEEFVDLFESHITSNTKLIVFSHITYKTGVRLPAKKICEMAQEYGIATLVDGAHSVGMLNLDLHDMGCDYFAGSGHKWQCGPGASGILYVRRERPNSPTLFPVNSSLYPYGFMVNITGQLQYVGHDNYPAKRALRDACEMWEDIGRDRIEEYVLSLSSLCKQKIQQTFGDTATIYSPDIPELTSGITAFNPFEDKTDNDIIVEFRDRLREEYGFVIRYTDFKVHKSDAANSHALRISTHLFHDRRQVNNLVEALYDLYRDMTS